MAPEDPDLWQLDAAAEHAQRIVRQLLAHDGGHPPEWLTGALDSAMLRQYRLLADETGRVAAVAENAGIDAEGPRRIARGCRAILAVSKHLDENPDATDDELDEVYEGAE